MRFLFKAPVIAIKLDERAKKYYWIYFNNDFLLLIYVGLFIAALFRGVYNKLLLSDGVFQFFHVVRVQFELLFIDCNGAVRLEFF